MKKSLHFAHLISFAILFSFISRSSAQCNNWLKIIPSNYATGVDIGDLDIAGTQMTIEAVFNKNEVNYYHPNDPLYDGNLVSKHTSPSDVNYLLRPNTAEITTSDGYFITPPICRVRLNKTYHVAMVYDGDTLKFYRNGFLMSQVPATGTLAQNNFRAMIGAHVENVGGWPEENLFGYINEVRIWNVARTQTEIQTYMSSSLPNPTLQTGLQAYYVFDDLTNKQGNSNYDGTFAPVGFPTYATASINQYNPTCSDFTIDSCAITDVSCNDFLQTTAANSGVAIGDLDVAGTRITVEAVFNPQAANRNYFGGDLVSKHGGPQDCNYLLRPMRAEITTNRGFFATRACNSALPLNVTNHVAMVYDGFSLKYFNNGYLFDSIPATGNLFQNNFITKIGSVANTQNTQPESFIGYINEVRIWNVIRTPEQLRAYADQQLPNPTNQPGLIAYYSFNSLTNKKNGSAWNGTLYGSAAINQQNAALCTNGYGYICPMARIADTSSSDTIPSITLAQKELVQKDLSERVNISPNPASNYVIITYPASSKNAYLIVLDITGRIVKSIAVTKSTTQSKIDLKNINRGIYRLIWKDEFKQESKMLIVN